MAGDLIVARPLGLAATVLGTCAFVLSLPFTLAAGSVQDAAQKLVIAPAHYLHALLGLHARRL